MLTYYFAQQCFNQWARTKNIPLIKLFLRHLKDFILAEISLKLNQIFIDDDWGVRYGFNSWCEWFQRLHNFDKLCFVSFEFFVYLFDLKINLINTESSEVIYKFLMDFLAF
jgi:hypothetical protein